MKLIMRGSKIVDLKEIFEGKEMTRKEMSKISFPEKIIALVSLQQIASSWGRKKDVIIWKL